MTLPHEPPRLVTPRTDPDRGRREKALGNAVVPAVAYVVGCLVRQRLGLGPPPPLPYVVPTLPALLPISEFS